MPHPTAPEALQSFIAQGMEWSLLAETESFQAHLMRAELPPNPPNSIVQRRLVVEVFIEQRDWQVMGEYHIPHGEASKEEHQAARSLRDDLVNAMRGLTHHHVLH